MEKHLTGKTLVFTDLHVGLSGNKETKLGICKDVVAQIAAGSRRHGVKNIIFCGDWFHSRTTLDVNSVNVALDLMESLAKTAKVYMVLGNHDLYLKDSVDVNSVNMFKSMDNVEIVGKTEIFGLNRFKCAFVPWLGKLDGLEKDSLDFMFGHFEVSSKYLTESYFEEHRAKTRTGSATSAELDRQLWARRGSGELVGNFVDPLKKTGTLFAGHIHQHREFLSKGKKFVFVGSPYQQNLGEYGYDTGYYLIDESGSYEFVETSAPKHVRISMSDVTANGVDGYDFSAARGNIVQKVYDVDVDPATDQAVNLKIAAASPYEELLPDYQVKPADARIGSDDEFSAESIQKSKISYIKNYIDKMDKEPLRMNGVDPEKLFKLMTAYYEKAANR